MKWLRLFFFLLTISTISIMHGVGFIMRNKMLIPADNRIYVIVEWNNGREGGTILSPTQSVPFTQEITPDAQNNIAMVTVKKEPDTTKGLIRFKAKHNQEYNVNLQNGDFLVTNKEGQAVFLLPPGDE